MKLEIEIGRLKLCAGDAPGRIQARLRGERSTRWWTVQLLPRSKKRRRSWSYRQGETQHRDVGLGRVWFWFSDVPNARFAR